MIDLPSLDQWSLVGACRPSAYGSALAFAQRVDVPLRLVVSQRFLGPAGSGRTVDDLLAGRRVSIPLLRRETLLMAGPGYLSHLLDFADRSGLVDCSRLQEFRPLRSSRMADLRPVLGKREFLSATFFDEERSYDVVFNLLPASGLGFSWIGGVFFQPAGPSPDNVPVWVSRGDGVMTAAEVAQLCDSSLETVTGWRQLRPGA